MIIEFIYKWDHYRYDSDTSLLTDLTTTREWFAADPEYSEFFLSYRYLIIYDKDYSFSNNSNNYYHKYSYRIIDLSLIKELESIRNIYSLLEN